MAQTYLNKKQELFCKFLAQGAAQGEAYELAGYEPSSANASTLANKPLIKERVAELRRAHEQRELEFRIAAHQAENGDMADIEIEKNAVWTFQRVMDMMGENVRLAQIAGEYKAANECLKMMGESMKMFEKATAKEDKPKGGSGPMTLIGQVTNILENQTRDEDGPANALAPRRTKPSE